MPSYSKRSILFFAAATLVRRGGIHALKPRPPTGHDDAEAAHHLAGTGIASDIPAPASGLEQDALIVQSPA